jgi:6-phosphofructokinase 1
MKIGILTGGGDVPGLNASIKSVVMRAAGAGHEVVGIRRGWAGLLELNPDDPSSAATHTVPLTPALVRTIDRSGGTFLHTSRTNPAKVRASEEPSFLAEGREGEERRDHTPHAMRVIDHLGLDALIPIGGDDTLSFALRLHQEGVPVVAIPKTMDNDVHGTDYCIGFSTAVTRTVIFVHQLRTSAGSHERIAVVEVFGRYSGETSLVSAYLGGVDRAIISEVPFDIDRLADLLARDKASNPSNYAMMTISEGSPADLRVAQGTNRQRHDLPTGGLPDALGLARLVGPDGGDQLRGDGGRPGDRGLARPTDGPTQRQLRERAARRALPGGQAGRRRGALRRVGLPAEDPPRRRQADVPVLTLDSGTWLRSGSICVRTR